METVTGEWRQRLERGGHKQRNPWKAAATRAGRERGVASRASRGSRALPTPGSQTSSLQSCERMNVCCFKPASLQ